MNGHVVVAHDEDEDRVIAYTLRDRRRTDRLERAVSGYTDEGGVFVPGLLQNTADGISVIRSIRRVAYLLVAVELLRGFGLSALEQEILKFVMHFGG